MPTTMITKGSCDMNYDGLKTATLSHNVMQSLTVATFNVPYTDNDSHDETVGQIINLALCAGLGISTVKRYTRSGFEMTFIQLRSAYADEEPTDIRQC